MTRRSQTTVFALTLIIVGATALTATPATAVTTRSLPTGVTVANLGTLAAPDYRLTVDCAALPLFESLGENDIVFASLPLPAGEAVHLEVANCTAATPFAYIVDEDRVVPQFTPLEGADAGVPQRAGVEWSFGDLVPLTASAYDIGANMSFAVAADADLTRRFSIITPLAVAVADPPGVRADELTMQLSTSTSPRLTITPDVRFPNLPEGVLMDGRPFQCGISSGDHFYDAREFVVTTPGRYSFRVADTTPPSQSVDFQQPIDGLMIDPVLALYSTFDAAHPHDGVVGCNDDALLDSRSWHYLTAGGTVMSVLYPQFTVTLQPGRYTLMLTTYYPIGGFTPQTAPIVPPTGDVSAVMAALKTTGALAGAAAPTGADGPETAEIEVWFEAGRLAETGAAPVDGGVLVGGLALMTLGGLVLASRRWSRG